MAPPPPIISFTTESVRQGLCRLASYEPGYVRLGALKTMAQMLERDLKRSEVKASQPEPQPDNPYEDFGYHPAASDSPAAQQAIVQQAAEAQEAQPEAEAEEVQQQGETNAEEDEDHEANQEDKPP